MQAYSEIMEMSSSPANPVFQKKYTGGYRVRRDTSWRKAYFLLMETCRERKSVSFGDILLSMFQDTGQIEASFSSKMLVTLDPDMPIWDSKVLKSLKLRLKGKTPEIRFSNAVILYDCICRWYKTFLETDEAGRMIRRFDQAFPEYRSFSAVKKIDFILWASQ